ncbi:Hsp33 family molecular chaperone HslO [Lacticaseibacillus thailandensis]|uniref:33 kDa chaperonin n=1 Tax=Lacticaseibacillus thailandensis DSM 22698 = JCM 13996 TaxID=1423810 RepID=A0A0R2CE46_9LACO|nr:Hsp33 family molecular chaperone HslO [Lacticaseibacillus thailandensis]KRM86649.1 heat shock protein Hsp33 [Lacticaseibacillus thailandensis DSM 22698 = JCM 13996]
MSDYLVRAVTADGMFRLFAVDATATVGEAQRRHDTWSASSAALGRALIGTGLLSAAELKNDHDLMTVRIKGDGPAGSIVVDGTSHGTVRGYIQEPHVHLPLNVVGKIDVARAVGKRGVLAVTKYLDGGAPFTGQVPLTSGELGSDFTYYLAKSEQIPASVGVSVFVNADNSIEVAGGFLVEALPGATDQALADLETNIKTLPLVSEMLKSGLTPEEILDRIVNGRKLMVLGQDDFAFKCNCSKERFGKALRTLKPTELQAMIDENDGAETVCKFCGERYQFSADELRAMLP